MGSRRKGRELALQILYISDIAKITLDKAVKGVTSGENVDPKSVVFAKVLANGAAQNKDILDKLIIKYADNWELHRMAALDRNILRLGAYELLYEFDTPISVIIDEAVEIAKSFSTLDSGKFVNGILDKIKLERTAENKNGKSPSQ